MLSKQSTYLITFTVMCGYIAGKSESLVSVNWFTSTPNKDKNTITF